MYIILTNQKQNKIIKNVAGKMSCMNMNSVHILSAQLDILLVM